MRIGFKTTIDENLLSQVKVKAIQEKVNVNDIIEILLAMYLNNEIKVEINKK